MKKIVFVFPDGSSPVPAINGGAIEKLIEMLIEQNEISQKFNFHIIMCKNKNDKTQYDYSKYTNTKFYDFHMSSAWSKFNRYINAGNKRLGYSLPLYSPYDRFIDNTIKSINPDYVIFEGSFTSAVRLLKKTVGREKLAYHIHHQITSKRDLSKFFSKIVCVSEFIKNDWVNNFNFKNSVKVVSLLNAIDSANFSKTISHEEKIQLRKSLGFNQDDFILIYVGRLVQVKGVDKLIMALKTISNPNVKLMIVGESVFKNSGQSSYTKYLVEIAKNMKDRIKFTGFIDNKELFKYYSIANCHIFTPVWEEAAGLVILESKRVGIPQIITNSGGIPEFSRRDAIVVEKENHLEQNLTNAIMHMYDKKDVLDYSSQEVFDCKFYFNEFEKIINNFDKGN